MKTAFLAFAVATGAGGIARLMAGPGPRILLDRPNEGTADVKVLADEVKGIFAKQHDAVKEIAEKALSEVADGNALAAKFKEKADEALTALGGKVTEAVERIHDLEQKAARGGGQEEAAVTLGAMLTDSDAFKAFREGGFSRGGKASVGLKADLAEMRQKATLTLAITDAAGSVGDGARAMRVPGINPMPQRRMTVRDLLTPGRMDSNALEFVKETGFTNSAAPVAEGAAKPESDIKLDLVTTSAKVIAHWTKASRQSLDDVSQLRSMIDQRLLYGLAYKEETQLLNGDGTGQNLNGLVTQATAYSAAFTPDADTAIDTLRLAMLQAALAEYPASGHILHPTDWARIELTKDAEGRYIIGNPQGTLAPTLWGLPVVATQAMTVDKFLTGAFSLGAQVFDRWDARVEVGYNNDDFTKNLVTILAEERLALAVYRPEAFIYGDLGFVA